MCGRSRRVIPGQLLISRIAVDADRLVKVMPATVQPGTMRESTILERGFIVVKTVDDRLCYLRWEFPAHDRANERTQGTRYEQYIRTLYPKTL